MESFDLENFPYTVSDSGTDLWDENGRWIPPEDPRHFDYLKAWIDSWDDPVDVIHFPLEQEGISDEEPF